MVSSNVGIHADDCPVSLVYTSYSISAHVPHMVALGYNTDKSWNQASPLKVVMVRASVGLSFSPESNGEKATRHNSSDVKTKRLSSPSVII